MAKQLHYDLKSSALDTVQSQLCSEVVMKLLKILALAVVVTNVASAYADDQVGAVDCPQMRTGSGNVGEAYVPKKAPASLRQDKQNGEPASAVEAN